MAEPVDWAGLMRLGLGQLQLDPDAFWAMTPGELLRAAEGAGLLAEGGQGIDRAVLSTLMAAFPDDVSPEEKTRQTDERIADA